MQTLVEFLGIQRGEAARIGLMAGVFAFLIAANNLLKIVRDSVFLSHHSVNELPYLYLLVAISAGPLIAGYSKYTATISLPKLIAITNGIVLSNVAFFWILLTYFDPGWSHYAFYVWAAIAAAIVIAQAWTLANEIFTSSEAGGVFGLLAAGGTIGGAMAAFGARWAIEWLSDANQLLWFVVFAISAASILVFWTTRVVERHSTQASDAQSGSEKEDHLGLAAVLNASRYFRSIGLLILLSVIVSTLIDFEFKAVAKETYSSKNALAAFFSSYYGWLSVVMFLVQTLLSGRVLKILGLFSSLYVTPGVLLTGTVTLLFSPSLVVAALTRIADVTLRNSVHRSAMEMLYLPLSSTIKKTMKPFLEVVPERIGDAAAGLVILLFSLLFSERHVHIVHLVCVGLIFIWILLIPILQAGYIRSISDNVIRRRTVMG